MAHVAGAHDVSSAFSLSPPQLQTPTSSSQSLRALRRSISKRFSHQRSKSDSAPQLAPRPSHPAISPNPSLGNPIKINRASSFHKSKPSKKSATLERAVPACTTCTPPNLRRLAVMANHEGQSGIACITSAYNHSLSPTRHSSLSTHSQTSPLRPRIRSSTTPQISRNASQVRRSPGSIRSNMINSSPKSKPRIEVVIPTRELNKKPLPSSPFFQNPAHSHTRSTSGDIEIMYNVSPPSASGHTLMRTSVVSPLNSQQRVHAPLPVIHATIDSVTTKSVMGSPNLSQGAGHSSDDSREDDADSVYSSHSSQTSNEAINEAATKSKSLRSTASYESIAVEGPPGSSPEDARIVAAPPRETTKSDASETRHQASPPLIPRRYAPHPPIEYDHEFIPSCSLRPLRVASGHTPCQSHSARHSASLASAKKMGMISQAVHRQNFSPNIRSPTLSEAENDLEQQLTAFSDDNAFEWDDRWADLITQRRGPLSPQGLARADSVTYALPPVPAVPMKSSRRSTLIEPEGFRLSRVPEAHIVSQLKRSKSKAKSLSIRIPDARRMTTDTFILSPIPIPPKDIKRTITPEVAEGVIFSILRNLESLDDLFACAIVNRGFYRVFKRHELELMKAALRKMSPPAWEHREMCYPGHDQLDVDEEELERPRQEYTPTSFIQYYTRDMYIIAAIKALIKDECQSFMRPEISEAIVSEDPEQSARVDDALWRIWTFCKIFGSGKGREEDIVAQMDWLKGGVLVHQNTCGHNALFQDDMNETLASAPECFAKGNEGGLCAEQLFDMMELWNCLGVLLQPIEGRTIQAREYGIYDSTNVRGGDIDGEEMMLDEWYYYLLTLGLSTVLDLTAPCAKSDASVFMVASQSGWAKWTPPMFGGTRRNFLKEAASRVYEDKVASTYAENSNRDVQRALSKQRIQKHISELRQRKNSGERLDVVKMSQERPMSEWEGVINNLTRPLPNPHTPSNNLVSHIPSLHSGNSLLKSPAMVIPEHTQLRTPSPLARPQTPPRRIVAQPLLPSPPPSTVPSTRDRSSLALSDTHPAFRRSDVPEMPRLEEHPAFEHHMRNMTHISHASNPPSSATNSATHSQRSSPSLDSHSAFQQHPLQRDIQDIPVENTVDRAVYRIVEMGFTPEQARQALRKTDLGDGLRVDRAVELLLREL